MQHSLIIVGQGLAGTHMAWLLWQRNIPFVVYDMGVQQSASALSSGIINPITGKRFLKTWVADQAIPLAKKTYRDLEQHLGETFLYEWPLLKIIEHVQELNDLSALASLESYAPYFNLQSFTKLDESLVQNPHGCLVIGGCAKVEVAKLLRSFRLFLQKENLLREEKFTSAMAMATDAKIVYCDGAAAAAGNHFFAHLPWLPAKGEYLLLHIPELENVLNAQMLKGATTISPTAEKNVYYVGATYEWNYPHTHPTSAKREEIEAALKKMLNCSYEMVAHRAAVRPTLQTRRPIALQHPTYRHIFTLNGLGTKGVSLAPYMAQLMVGLLA